MKKTVLFLSLVFLFSSAMPGWALKTYDDFESGMLSTDLWDSSRQGDASLNCRDGQVELVASAAAGSLDTNKETVASHAGGAYTEVSAEVAVAGFNRTNATVDLGASLRLSLYNDGSGNEGREGEVCGYIRISPAALTCGLERITDSDGTACETLWEDTFAVGQTQGKTYVLGIKWTGTLAFFSIQGPFERTMVLSTLYAPETTIESLGSSHLFSIGAEAVNTESGTSGSVSARFDNVQINFSASELAALGSVAIADYKPIATGDSRIVHYWEGEREGQEFEVEDGVEEIYYGEPVAFHGYQVIPEYQGDQGYAGLIVDGDGQKYAGEYEEMEGEEMSCYFDSPVLLYPATIAHGVPHTAVGTETCVEEGETESATVTWTLQAEGFEDVSTPLGTFSDCLKLGIEILFDFSAEERGVSYRVLYLAPGIGPVLDYETEYEESEYMYQYSEILAYQNDEGAYATNREIPNETIMIDGDTDDWQNLTPVYTDYSYIDVDSGPEGDLNTLYLAHDYQYLYGYCTFADGSFPAGGSCSIHLLKALHDRTGGLSIGIGDPDGNPFINLYITAPEGEQWQKIGEWGEEFPWEANADAPTASRAGEGVEFRVPLAPLANIAHSYLAINTYTDTAGVDSSNTGYQLTYLQAPQVLYYPHVANNATWETEIGIINQSGAEASGALVFYADHENNGAFIDGEILWMLPVSLAPHGRYSFHCWDLPLGPMVTDSTGYIVYTGDGSLENTAGYEKFYTHNSATRVAVPAVEKRSEGDIYISHIASNDRWWTGISLVNTTTATKDLTIDFDNRSSQEVSLAPGEHRAFSVQSLFGSKQEDIGSAVISNASGIIGLELFGSPGGASANYLSGVLLKDALETKLYYPHVDTGDAWWTGIVACDPLLANEELLVTPYTENGSPLAPVTISLDAEQYKMVGNPDDLGFPAETAWFTVEAASGITGFELFGTNDANRLGGYTGVGISGKQGSFAKIEDNGWTGIAFVNAEEEPAQVTLTAYNDAGESLATTELSLGGYAKQVDVAPNLFQSDISGATYIDYSSDREIVGFQLNSSGMMLDALSGL